jgi:hypothetical protein
MKKITRQQAIKQINEIILELDKKQSSYSKINKDKVKENNKIYKNKNKDFLQEALDYLRVAVKYTAFDLEATRRENKRLKKKIDGQGN